MRIIAGQWRGRSLQAPLGLSTRPTADRVRETLFSMLTSRIGSFDGLRVADLFAGSGALGLEALSRGASHCTFVENNRQSLDAIRANVAGLGAGDHTAIVAGSALALPPAQPFDLILADPPYTPGSGNALVESVSRSGWLGPNGWLCVETAGGETVKPAGLSVDAERDIGRARITLLRAL